MCTNNLRALPACTRVLLLCLIASQMQASDSPALVKLSLERVERNGDKVLFSIKIANTSAEKVFMPGTNFKTPRPYSVFLEQWQGADNWRTVAPCWDTVPQGIVSLNAGATMTLHRYLKLPARGCKDPNIKLEGKFRYRLEYFASRKEVETYTKSMNSPDWQRSRAPAVFSEAFEIPPIKK